MYKAADTLFILSQAASNGSICCVLVGKQLQALTGHMTETFSNMFSVNVAQLNSLRLF